MPRRPRQKSETGFYHVTTRGINHEPVYNENRERSRMLNLIRENYEKYNIKFSAYCIMQNHIHLLVKSELEDLSSFMAKVLAEYAKYYNYKHSRSGYVFQGRFHSQCIESEAHYWNCLRYIHMNPLRAKLCRDIGNYKYSSAKEYLYPEKYKDSILDKDAYTLNLEKFQEVEGFETFHKRNSRDVFVDTPEEELCQRKEIAEEILWNMSKELGISEVELLDYCKTRELFNDVLIRLFDISGRSAKKLQTVIRAELRTR